MKNLNLQMKRMTTHKKMFKECYNNPVYFTNTLKTLQKILNGRKMGIVINTAMKNYLTSF